MLCFSLWPDTVELVGEVGVRSSETSEPLVDGCSESVLVEVAVVVAAES